MVKIFQLILLFPSVTKTRIVLLLGLTAIVAFLEGFGVAIIFPILDFIEKGRDFDALSISSEMWARIGRIFELFSIPKNLEALMIIAFGLMFIRLLFNYLKNIYSRWMTESIAADIRNIGFERFARTDISFYDSYGVGEIINVLTVDGRRSGGGFSTVFVLMNASFILAFYFIVLLVLEYSITLLAMAVIGSVGLIMKSRIAKSGLLGIRVSKFNADISFAIVERLNGVRLLKLTASEDKEIRFVQKISDGIKLSIYRIARIGARMDFLVELLVVFAGFFILYFSVEVFQMTLAKIGTFMIVLFRLMPYTKDIFNSRQRLAGLSGSIFRVNSLFEEAKQSSQIANGRIKNVRIEKGIKFDNVSFFYNREDGFVLNDLSVFIPAGKMTAIVGRSGAGKSTFVDLIPRLRVPVHGTINIDKTPVQNFDLSALRRSISFVSQEGFLFDNTIENNIKYSRPGASIKEIEKASRMAYAHEFIKEFSEGYKTQVGERGIKLSGGERQRIILARALLQESSIIILDEPTSSLDSESEDYIQRAMERIRAEENITMIIIAHRFSTIRSADQIIVLDQGKIIESGSHAELLHGDSWYADMIKMQALG